MSEIRNTDGADISGEQAEKRIVEMSSPGLDLLAKVATQEYSSQEKSAIVDTCSPEHIGFKFEREQEAAQAREGEEKSITAASVSPTSGEVPFPD